MRTSPYTEGDFLISGGIFLAKKPSGRSDSIPSSQGPEKVGGLIQGLMQRLGFAARLEKESAVTMWAEVVGPKIAEETKALKIDGDTLVVKVSRAAWRQQLTFMKPDLLAKLDATLRLRSGSSATEEGCIKDIRFI
jgi:predicted nucleic acid-binding Zn ribbon protein